MAEELGYHRQGRTGPVQLDGEGVPQAVRMDALLDPGLGGHPLEHHADVLRGYGAAAIEKAEQRAAADAEVAAPVDPAHQRVVSAGVEPAGLRLTGLGVEQPDGML